jgi:hypothetical protein
VTELRQEMVEIDLDGEAVRVPRDVVGALASAAAARAGISERHRDLSLVLHRALDSGQATLKRTEMRALRAVLEERPDRFGPAGAQLLRTLG